LLDSEVDTVVAPDHFCSGDMVRNTSRESLASQFSAKLYYVSCPLQFRCLASHCVVTSVSSGSILLSRGAARGSDAQPVASAITAIGVIPANSERVIGAFLPVSLLDQ
jgi:hypothetical protein